MSYSWNNFAFPSPIDDILKKPGFTLQELLDEDDVVLETKNQKQDLLWFLTTKENISQLVSYMVDEPPPSTLTSIINNGGEGVPNNVNIKFRYPVVSCEILSSEINDIERVLLDNEDLMDRFFAFFDKPKVNLLLANLVVKVLKSILSSKIEDMFNYLKRKFNFIDLFLNHMEAVSITEFFTRLISLDGDIDGMSTQQWLTEIGFVEKLIGKLAKEFIDIHSDVSQGIIDIMGSTQWGTVLMNRFASEGTSRLLFKTIVDPENPHGFRYGMKVFNKLLKGLSVAQESHPDSDEEDSDKPRFAKPDPLGPMEQLPPPIQVLVSNLSKFCELLKNPLSSQKITDQTQKSYEAFGFDRYLILEMVEILLDLNYLAVNKALLGSGIFLVGCELVFSYSHNTFCLRSFEAIVVKFLENSGQEIQLSFLEKTQLAKKLVETDKNDNQIHEPGKFPAYTPFFRRMIYSIGEIAERAPHLKSNLEEIEGWKELLQLIKEERKKLETATAGAKVEEEPTFFQPPNVMDPVDDTNDAYEEGRDDDDEDLNLEDDQDMDSANDADDYDADQAEILLTKQEIEASA